MIRTILVPTSGSDSDERAFITALAVARPLAAHLTFYHLRLSPCEAAQTVPHIGFAVGSSIGGALQTLHRQELQLSAKAAQHVRDFCAAADIPIGGAPPAANQRVTASWLEEQDAPLARLLFHARHNDLTVIGRSSHDDHLPARLIETLLREGGRPLVLAPDRPAPSHCGCILLGWGEDAASARALTAAMPLLERAERVLVAQIGDDGGMEDLIRQLAWHGVAAEPIARQAPPCPSADRLAALGLACGAELLVVGGLTPALIEHGDLPVLMLS